MRAVLEYSLPEEREEFELATNASNVHASISHLDDVLRSAERHQGRVYATIPSVRAALNAILNGEKLDDIYIETWESRK